MQLFIRNEHKNKRAGFFCEYVRSHFVMTVSLWACMRCVLIKAQNTGMQIYKIAVFQNLFVEETYVSLSFTGKL